MKNLVYAAIAASLLSVPSIAGETPSPDGAAVYFVNVSDGDTLKAGSTVVFGLTGMGVAPVGTELEDTGHHHLLINRAPYGEAEGDDEIAELGIPADENHVHFGGGQTETVLDLPPGEHTLQLVLGDLYHIPHEPPVVSAQITVTVE